MSNRAWTPPLQIVVPVTPAGKWSLVHDYVPPDTVVKVETTGMWHFRGAERAVGPDGDPTVVAHPDDRPLSTVPHGAVIAKLGGGTAGTSNGTLHGGGSFFVVVTDANTSGPLFVAVNLDPSRIENGHYWMSVSVSMSQR